MHTEIVFASSPDTIPQALAILRASGLVAFPTDTVYGIGALAFDGKAVEAIYAAKDRPIEKAIPILIADTEDVEKVGREFPEPARRLAARTGQDFADCRPKTLPREWLGHHEHTHRAIDDARGYAHLLGVLLR